MKSMNLRAESTIPGEIAVLIPCYNEEPTIASVVKGFREALPNAGVYVYDNNSADGTAREAEAAGAIVRRERLQGKGAVVRRMFAEIDADYYVLVDGDGTYEASAAAAMISALQAERLAMMVARRVRVHAAAGRSAHVFGNRLFTKFVRTLFGPPFTDILSGYRVFSRAFVKSFPVFSRGFEIETELTVHALTLGLPVAEIATPYRERPEGSSSKLRAFRDGARILFTIVALFKDEKPLPFFGSLGLACLGIAMLIAYPLVVHYLETGLVPRFPTAILATGLAVYALIMFACGIILDTVTQGRREMKLLAYLNAGRTA
jgi:glycosyltransferase involved in cell wall biosynthesis